MKYNIFLIAFIILAVVLTLGSPLFYNIFKSIKMIENYQNYDINNSMSTSLGGDTGKYPFSESDVLLEDTYPVKANKELTNNDAANIWWHYPIFQLGSYDQITNNIRYPNNPDVGTCMPASMCGSLYKEKQLKTNYIKPLPLINPNCGTRIGYFDTSINMLPFRTDMPNILY